MNSENKETSIIELTYLFLILIKKYSKIFLASFVLIVLFTMVYIFLSTPIFKTEMIVSSSVVNSERLLMLIEPIGELAKEGNYNELSRLLNIDSVSATNIAEIEAKNVEEDGGKKSENYDSEILRQQNCIVILKLNNGLNLSDTIQSGILYYLKQNDFIKRKALIEETNFKFMKTRIQHEIKELDSLKLKFPSINNINLMDPSSINNSIANLYQQELSINLRLSLLDGGVNIIRTFAKYKNPVSPRKSLILVISFVLWLLCNVLYIFIMEFIYEIQKIKIE